MVQCKEMSLQCISTGVTYISLALNHQCGSYLHIILSDQVTADQQVQVDSYVDFAKKFTEFSQIILIMLICLYSKMKSD